MLDLRGSGRSAILCVEELFPPGGGGASTKGRSRISIMEFCLERPDGGTNDRLLDVLLPDCPSECSESLFLLSAAIMATLLAASCARLAESCLPLDGFLMSRIHDSLSMAAVALSEDILLLESAIFSSRSLSLCSLLSRPPLLPTLGSGWPCTVCIEFVRGGCP